MQQQPLGRLQQEAEEQAQQQEEKHKCPLARTCNTCFHSRNLI